MTASILNIDARSLLSALPTESVDLVWTDPPYRTISGGNRPGGEAQGKRPSGMLSKNDGKIFRHNDICVSDWAGGVYRALRSPGHCYVMTNLLNLWSFHDALIATGFKLHNLLIWKKNNATPNRWFMKDCEYILFMRKGPARSIYTCGAKTVLDYPNVRGKTHETEKPVPLIRSMVEASTLPGQLVLDPFAGTGSTGVACIESGRNFIGSEIDPAYAAIARERIQ